jgi:hypothetical protein
VRDAVAEFGDFRVEDREWERGEGLGKRGLIERRELVMRGILGEENGPLLLGRSWFVRSCIVARRVKLGIQIEEMKTNLNIEFILGAALVSVVASGPCARNISDLHLSLSTRHISFLSGQQIY